MLGSLYGARVLDLYAGSGAVGLEALSRGAEYVLLVEHGARAARVIRENIEAIGLPGAVLAADRVERVLARGPAPAGASDAPAGASDASAGASDAPAGASDVPARTSETPAGRQDDPERGCYDVVFADPPYALADAAVSQVLSLLAGQGWLAPGALVIVERATRSGPVSWPDWFVPDKARRYGEATFWYGLASASDREGAR